MHYLSHIPETITPSTQCIIMLHGVGSNAADLFSLASEFGNTNYVFSLEGPFSLGGGGHAWYPVDFSTGKPVYSETDVDTGYNEIIACIDEVTEKYDIKCENIFLLGFSQGAIMSYYSLWKSPEKIGGIIALSGRLLAEIDTTRIQGERYSEKKVFIGHGELDTVIPASASVVTRQFIETLGVTPSVQLYRAPHTITKEEISDIKNWLSN